MSSVLKKWAAFACALCISISFVWQVLTPKYFFDDSWPTTSTYLGFYKMEKNTVDVLFFGSSHAASFFLPQELYNGYGITGYNLGCEQQNLVISYFWLKEALRFQKPKAVVIDCYMLFPYKTEEPLNTEEGCTRKALDYMRWSQVKREAVGTVCRLDGNQSLSSYYFPNIRYHKRWENLSENDFSFSKMAGHNELKGYAPQAAYSGWKDFVPFEKGSGNGAESMEPLMEEYLNEMEELCRREEIQLVLVKTPGIVQSPERSLAIQNYADEHKLPFLDINEKELYQEINWCFETDNCDGEHGSLWGAQKVTRKIGEKLADWYGMGGHKDSQWETTKEYYEGIKKDCELAHMTDMEEYTQTIQDGRYSVFISVRNEGTSKLKDSVVQNLKNIGLQTDLHEKYSGSYLAVVSNGDVKEQSGNMEMEIDGAVRENLVRYEMVSVGNQLSSIKIGGEEYSKNGRGMNIVVYNHETKRIVDSVCFDIGTEGCPAVR